MKVFKIIFVIAIVFSTIAMVALTSNAEEVVTTNDENIINESIYEMPVIGMDNELNDSCTYSRAEYNIWVNIDNPEICTYTWYKDGKNIGLTTRTITVKNVADSGEYYCVVEGDGKHWTTDSVTVTINPAHDLDLSNVTLDASKFDYIDAEGNLIFDNKNRYKVIALFGADNLAYTIPEITHTLGANSVEISFTSADGNYIGTKTFEWSVKNIVDLSELKWHDTLYDNVPSGVGIYTGEEYNTVELVVPEEYKAWIDFFVNGVTGTDAGTYIAAVDSYIYDEDTVHVIGVAPIYEWTIAKCIINVDFLVWNYNTFVYNNTSFSDLIKITNLPAFVTATYTTEGEGTNVGTYKTIATLALNAEYAMNYELNAETVEHEWTVTPYVIYVTGINWGCNHIFNNENYTISATPVLSEDKGFNITFKYAGITTAKKAGTYVVRVAGLVLDDPNYIVVFADGLETVHEWTISPKLLPAFSADVIQLLTENGALYPMGGFVYAPGVVHGVKVNEWELPVGVKLVIDSISGNSGTLAGTYTLKFKLTADDSGNYIFEETEYSIDWKINKAYIDYNNFTFSSKEFVYDGKYHSLEVTMDDSIKSLVDIKYFYDGILDADNTGKHLIGTYRVTVVIAGKDTANYEEFELMLGPKDLVIKGERTPDDEIAGDNESPDDSASDEENKLPDEELSTPENNEEPQKKSWFELLIMYIIDFFKKLFGFLS